MVNSVELRILSPQAVEAVTARHRTAAGFADPEYGLVETWAFIGMPGESKHRDRNP